MKALAGAALLISMFAATPAHATVIISDNFDSGTAGTALNGAAVQYYDSASYGSAPTWYGSAGTIYSATTAGVISSATNATTILGLVSVTDQSSGVMTLQADVRVGSSSWVGLGFLNGTNWFGTNNTVFSILNGGGYVTTQKNGSTAVGTSAAYTGFVGTNTYTLKLVYDLDASTIKTYVNGTQMSSYVLTGLNSSVINQLGFRIFNEGSAIADSGRIDNFIYDYAAVPEPSTFALFAGAGLMGLVLNRRRSARL